MGQGRSPLAANSPEEHPMTRRRELEQHRHQMGEIREIMNAMKNLALMETRKLARFLESQSQVVRDIETAAADFLDYYPYSIAEDSDKKKVVLLLGSERGFCGDFNDALLKRLEADTPVVIAVGHRLCVSLKKVPRVAALLDGANVAEDIFPVLNRVVTTLSSMQGQMGTLEVLYHDMEEGRVRNRRLLPPFQASLDLPPRFPHPPLLNESPESILADLADHYLFAALHEIAYTSLMAENHRRIQHLEGALQHLDEQAETLVRRCHNLRQEEITEEIELILLSATEITRELELVLK